MNEQIHWHEGLFLQPHHLQAMQRNLLERFADERRLQQSYPYGIVESRLSPDALENHTIRFDRLHAVMPGGLELSFPENADVPTLDIKRVFESSSEAFTVYLGVPLWYGNRANTIDRVEGDWRVKRLYHVTERSSGDENTGENVQPVLVRRINARLLLGEDDQSDLDVIPLLRIAHATGAEVGLPRQDTSFIPPCFVLGGSTVLRDMTRDLANQVEASRKELAVQLARGGFSIENMRGVQFEQMLRLRTLNRFGARLPSLAAAAAVTPFQMYLELRELLAELAALHPERDQFDVAPYDHDNPAVAFQELDGRIRPFLKGAVKGRFIEVPFIREGRMLATNLTEDHLTLPNEYFLGIRTKQDPRAVAKLVEDADQFKLMPKSMIKLALWGIRLTEERHPPMELPAQTGLNYFRLRRADSTKMWEATKRDRAMAIRWGDVETSDFQIALYMTVPEVGS
jgi:type VI secretion system ImpJ/VasE family protein